MDTLKASKNDLDNKGGSISTSDKKGKRRKKRSKKSDSSKVWHFEFKVRRILEGILLIAAFILIWQFARGNATKTAAATQLKPPPIPVVVANAHKGDIPIYLAALGSVVPSHSVVVKTQIDGQLMEIFFKEGQMVRAGSLLAEIDPKPYQAQLIQYEGQLLRDKALLENARLDLKRYEELRRQDSVSQQTLDAQRALVEQYEGNVKFDVGQIEGIKLKLDYCKITSPIDGKVGLRRVDPGNVVQTTDPDGLVVINAMHPINVIFSIPEDNLPQILRATTDNPSLKIDVYDRTQNKLLSSGFLATIDNQIDPATGTVKIKAEFKNESSILFPNQFVNVQLLVSTLHDVLVIPSAAIQTGAEGSFVYQVNNNKSVSMIPVTIMAVHGDDTAVQTKLLAGQPVVVEGTDKLKEGVEVSITDTRLAGAAKE